MQERKFAFLNPCAIILLNSRHCGVLGSFTETDELPKTNLWWGFFIQREKLQCVGEFGYWIYEGACLSGLTIGKIIYATLIFHVYMFL